MKRALAVLFCLVLVASWAVAASPFVSLSGVAATGAGSVLNVNGPVSITWQTTFTGTPTAITVNLEGSIDGTNYFVLDTSTSTTAEMRHVVNKQVDKLRCNITAYTVNSSTATCSLEAYK